MTWSTMRQRAMVKVCIGCALLFSIPVQRGFAQRTVASANQDAVAKVTSDLLARRVSLHVKNLSLQRAIDTVAALGKVHIAYSLALLGEYNVPVSMSVDNMPLGMVFERLLAGTKLQIIGVANGRLMVSASEADISASQGVGTVSGRVVDSANGRGLIGAVVKIPGTKFGAVTTDSGVFLIRNVPSGEQVLTIRLFGYRPVSRTVTVTANERATIRVTLASVPTMLTGVVTSAAGPQRKIEVGNDITAINVDSIMRTAPVHSVTDLLESRVPGLTVVHTSGTPGDPSRIRLRGAGSITGNNDPIVIVDGIRIYARQSDTSNHNLAAARVGTGTVSASGVASSAPYARPSPLDQIDPNSIETIEVLKGPSASALYGSDAANGVIVITRKRGRAGPTRINASLNGSRSTLPGSYPLNYFRFGHERLGPYPGVGTQNCPRVPPAYSSCVLDSIVPFQALNNARLSPVAGHGTGTGAALTVSGGSQSGLTYSVTGSASSTLGLIKLPALEVEKFEQLHTFTAPDWMKRPDRYSTWGGSSVLSTPVGRRGGVIALSSDVHNSVQQRSSLQSVLAKLQSVYFDTGGYQSIGATLGNYTEATPFKEFYEKVTASTLNFNNAVNLSLPIRTGWLLTSTAGLSVLNQSDKTLTPRDYILGTVDSMGVVSQGHQTTTTKTLNAGFQPPPIALVGSVKLMMSTGINVVNESANNVSVTGSGLAIGSERPLILVGSNGLPVPGTGLVGDQGSGGRNTYGMYFATTLDFGSRFFANPGIRFDGGSGTGSNASGSLPAFPKLDFSWIAIDRTGNDRPLFGIVSLLRPRLSYGRAGVQPSPGATLRLYQEGVVTIPGNPPTTIDIVQLSSVGNTKLHPERSSEIESGFDANLWGDRVDLTISTSRKMQNDAIIAIPLAPSIYNGPTIYKNIGKIRNTSFEATYNVTLAQQPSFYWKVGGNVTNRSNEVLQLAPGVAPITFLDGTRVVAGYPLFGRWAKPITGFADINNDGTISPNEIAIGDTAVYVGQQDPRYVAAFNTDLTVRNISVHTTFSYQNGLTQFNQGSSSFVGQLFNDPNAPLARQAAFIASSETQGAGSGTPYGLIQRINELRWQSLSINYIVPVSIAKRFRSSYMSIALQGSNLWLKSNYRGIDPSVNAFSTGNSTQDTGQLPQPRTWTLEMRVGN